MILKYNFQFFQKILAFRKKNYIWICARIKPLFVAVISILLKKSQTVHNQKLMWYNPKMLFLVMHSVPSDFIKSCLFYNLSWFLLCQAYSQSLLEKAKKKGWSIL